MRKMRLSKEFFKTFPIFTFSHLPTFISNFPTCYLYLRGRSLWDEWLLRTFSKSWHCQERGEGGGDFLADLTRCTECSSEWSLCPNRDNLSPKSEHLSPKIYLCIIYLQLVNIFPTSYHLLPKKKFQSLQISLFKYYEV